MRNSKGLKVKVHPVEDTEAKLAGDRAQVPTQSNTNTMKHNGKSIRKSKGSSPSHSASVRDGRVSPLQEPPSPCGSNKDSLIWALDEDAPHPKRVAQGIPNNISFKPASTAPHPPQMARRSSKQPQHPRVVQHDRRYQDFQQTDNWTTIPLDGWQSKATTPQRPIRAVPARPQDHGVYAMQPIAEAGRAQNRRSSRYKKAQSKMFRGRHHQCTTRKFYFGLFTTIMVIAVIIIMVVFTKK